MQLLCTETFTSKAAMDDGSSLTRGSAKRSTTAQWQRYGLALSERETLALRNDAPFNLMINVPFK